MFKSMKKTKVAGLAMSAAIIGSSVGMVGLPTANAAGGVEDPNNGIVWGVGSDGSYMVPIAGGDQQGWCIDPGKAYPKQNGATQYSEPVAWGGQLSPQQSKQLMVGMVIGKAVVDGQIPPFAGQVLSFLGFPNASTDDIAAAASAVAHDVGANSDGGNHAWDPNRMKSGTGRQLYDRIMQYAPMIPVTPNQLGMTFSIRTPTDGSDKQRMIVMSDLKIPTFTLPSISLPSPSPSTSTGTTTPNTSTGTTTPSTAPVSTPSSTPEKPQASIRTSAGGKSSNVVEEGATITDTVTYTGLTPGQEYVIKGETVVKSTGEKDGNKGEATFTPKTANGRVDVQIPVKSVKGQELVVFESVTKKGDDKVVAKHEDKNDKSQTVGRAPSQPQIRTNASSSTGNYIQSGTTVDDQVTYTGLTPGKKYRLEARLMCKDTGGDTGASQTHEFTPATADGTETVAGIAVTNPDCHEQVAFEKLYDEDGKLVASHEDITDSAQTVGGQEMLKKKKEVPAATPGETPAPAAPQAQAQADANAAAPANTPLGIGGAPSGATPLGTGGGSAPRQVIASVPSGDSVALDLFSK